MWPTAEVRGSMWFKIHVECSWCRPIKAQNFKEGHNVVRTNLVSHGPWFMFSSGDVTDHPILSHLFRSKLCLLTCIPERHLPLCSLHSA